MPGLPEFPPAIPGDDDLVGVVTHLAPVNTRHGLLTRDPNEPEVRWLLEAGVRAMQEGFLDRSCEATGPVAYSHANGLFDTLPVERVMQCFRDLCREAGVDPGSANKARLIRRWAFAANYQLDLIAYVFRPALLRCTLDRAMQAITATWGRMSLGELITHFATPQPGGRTSTPIDRLQQIVRLMFPTDPQIQRFARDLQDIENRHWARFYVAYADACGLPAPDMSWEELAAVTQIIGKAGGRQATQLGFTERMDDGTPAVVAATRCALAGAFGIPWRDLADLRPQPGSVPPGLAVDFPGDTALAVGM